jgi:hypothetical protein
MYLNGHPFAIAGIDYLCTFIAIGGCTSMGVRAPSRGSHGYFLSPFYFLLPVRGRAM